MIIATSKQETESIQEGKGKENKTKRKKMNDSDPISYNIPELLRAFMSTLKQGKSRLKYDIFRGFHYRFRNSTSGAGDLIPF